MSAWIRKLCGGNIRTASLIVGFLSTNQFVVEVIVLLCFSVYIVPFPVVIKVFYAFAAISAPVCLFASVIYIFSVSKDNYAWMRPWLISYIIVTISEIIISLVAFIQLYGLNGIFQLYASAWVLAIQHQNDQLYLANGTNCTRLSTAALPTADGATRVMALISQVGPEGTIICVAILLLLKNVVNVFMLLIGFTQYRELLAGRGYRRRYTPSVGRTCDPHARSPRRVAHFSSVRTVTH